MHLLLLLLQRELIPHFQKFPVGKEDALAFIGQRLGQIIEGNVNGSLLGYGCHGGGSGNHRRSRFRRSLCSEQVQAERENEGGQESSHGVGRAEVDEILGAVEMSGDTIMTGLHWLKFISALNFPHSAINLR